MPPVTSRRCVSPLGACSAFRHGHAQRSRADRLEQIVTAQQPRRAGERQESGALRRELDGPLAKGHSTRPTPWMSARVPEARGRGR